MAVDSKSPKKASLVELQRRLDEGSVPDEELRQLMRSEIARRLQWGYKPTYDQQLSQLLSFAKCEYPIKIHVQSNPSNGSGIRLFLSS